MRILKSLIPYLIWIIMKILIFVITALCYRRNYIRLGDTDFITIILYNKKECIGKTYRSRNQVISTEKEGVYVINLVKTISKCTSVRSISYY